MPKISGLFKQPPASPSHLLGEQQHLFLRHKPHQPPVSQSPEMQIKSFLQKLDVREHVTRAIDERRRSQSSSRISHGLCSLEDHGNGNGLIARREQIGASEIWLFGASDQSMADVLAGYLQLVLFHRNLAEDQYEKMAKMAMRKAYELARPVCEEGDRRDGGSTTAVVIGGVSFVAADFGGYRAVVSKGGVAVQIGGRLHRFEKTKLLFKSIKEKLMRRVRQSEETDEERSTQELVIATEFVKFDTEFMVLASDGLWEVMQNQEAVDLIWHIENSQEAAECLAKEAMNRRSKSPVSCIVVRFQR